MIFVNSNKLTPLLCCPERMLLALTLLAAPGLARPQESAPAAVPAINRAALAQSREDREREVDKQHLRVIYQAIQAYRQKHGDMPNWLSDLVPDFISDTNILMSPVELRTGRSVLWGYGDPKVRSSYIYEFNQSDSGRKGDQDVALTMRQWKILQMEEFGPVVPMLRCHLHDPILNLSYSGEVYETALFWESDTNTLALMARVGSGPGAREGQKLRLTALDAASGEPVPAAEVEASNRQSEFGPLPPRHMTTDAKGQCEVNLGGKNPKGIRLRVGKPGYANVQEEWGEGSIPDEWTARLQKAVMVGGLVKDTQGKAVSGLIVVVSGLERDSVGQVTRTEYDSVRTDSSGKWSSQRVPAGFDSLALSLSHPEFVPVEYDQATPQAATVKVVSKESLLAGTAEMQVQPGTVVEGKVQDAKGQPISQAQVLLQITKDDETSSQRGETSAGGHFRFVVTTTGTATLVAEAGGLAPKHLALAALEGQPALEPVTLTLLKGRTVQGRVVDAEGKAVAGANIVVASWNNVGPLKWHSESDADGRFTWDSAPSERTLLQFSKSGFKDRLDELPSAGTRDWSIRLDKPFAYSGTVLDPDGKPAAGLAVTLFPFSSGEAHTDAQGHFTLTARNMPVGFVAQCVLVARDPARELAAAVDVEEDAAETTLRLSSGLTLVGRVTDVDGHAIRDAHAQAMFRTARTSEPFGMAVRADAEGRYEIKGLAAGRGYGVSLSAEGFGQDYLNVDAPEAGSQRIELDPVQLIVADQRIAGTVLDTDDKAVSGAYIGTFGNKQPSHQMQTDAKGHFAFDHVCVGTVQVFVNSPRGGYANASVEAGDTNATIHLGTSSPIRAQAERRATLRGKPLPDLAAVELSRDAAPVGKPVLLCLFDIEQRPSRRFVKQLADQHEALRQKGLTVLGVQAAVTTADSFKEWKDGNPVPFPVGRLAEKADKTRWVSEVESLPWLILTDGDRRVTAEGFALDELEAKLKGLAK